MKRRGGVLESGIEIHVKGDSGQVFRLKDTLSIGRSPSNDLILQETGISGRHAFLWLELGMPWIRDLGSRNGTTLNGEPVLHPMPLDTGDEIGIGTFELAVRGRGVEVPQFIIEQAEGTVAVAIPDTGLRFGTMPAADIRSSTEIELSPGPGHLTHRAGPTEVVLRHGSRFDIDGIVWRVREVGRTVGSTVGLDVPPLRLIVGLEPPLARLERLDGTKSVEFTAENRVALLYVLAERPDGCSTDDAIVGVWGRSALVSPGGKLKSLVYRIREQARLAGFDDGWLLRDAHRLALCVRDVNKR